MQDLTALTRAQLLDMQDAKARDLGLRELAICITTPTPPLDARAKESERRAPVSGSPEVPRP